MHTKFWSENLKGGDNMEDLGVNGKINIRSYLRKTDWEGVEWIHLAEDRG
jgi:hypothetical protein